MGLQIFAYAWLLKVWNLDGFNIQVMGPPMGQRWQPEGQLVNFRANPAYWQHDHTVIWLQAKKLLGEGV